MKIYEVSCRNRDVEDWCDSYWETEEQARAEAERLMTIDEDTPLDLLRITIFARAFCTPGEGVNSWNNEVDEKIATWYCVHGLWEEDE